MTAFVLALAAVSTGVVALGAWVVYALARQQGRLVLRLDALEARLAAATAGGGGGCGCADGAPAERPGLAVGAEAPAFAIPDLDGTPVRLEDFRGQQVLLVNWSPSCGYCTQIAPELARHDAALRERGVRTLLLAHGDAAQNRTLAAQHGLTMPILLSDDGAPAASEVFRNQGTPVAYLLDATGRVAERLAIGAAEVPALARRLAEGRAAPTPGFGTHSVAGSRIVRDGLKPGTPAPTFTLPDALGRGDVSLDAYRGRRVLLVFSDPDCAPCRTLAPRLAAVHREHAANGLAVVMVGRGGAEANRRKAAEHGLEFPIVLQERWELSRQYGIFATPVGFLIDERGVIAREVATGPDQIVSLASDAAPVGRSP